MFIRVESSSGVPITRQIADQIRGLNASGALQAGDRLPSVRQLAKDLAVNPNTILHVYEKLTAEGLLERRQGDGTYVSQNSSPRRKKAQMDLLLSEIDRLTHRAADLGIEADETRRLVEESLARVARERSANKASAKGQP